MKNTIISGALATALLITTAKAESEIRVSNEFSAVYNSVSGPGKGSSSLTPGLNFLDTLSLYGGGTAAGRWNYSYNAGLKAGDDPRADAKKVSLTGLQGRLTDKTHTLSAGDVFESFSQYSLASSLKGGSYRFAKEGSRIPELTAVFGWAYPRWDSLWRDPDTRTVKRQVWGSRLKTDLIPDLAAGISAVGVKDTERVSAGDSKYDGSNLTLDLAYNPIPGLTISGEHSRSDYDEAAAGSSEKGSATRIEAIGDADPSRVSMEYERVEPDFLSPMGASTPDRLKFKTRWRYKASKRVTVNSGLLWYRNNLDGQLSGTSRFWKPEVSVAVKRPLASRPYSFADLSYKFDRKYGASGSASDHYLSANWRDRYGEIDHDLNLGYTMYDAAGVREAGEVNFNTSLNTRLQKGDFVWKPSLNLGGWYSSDELTDFVDKVYEYSLGLGFEAPEKNLSADLRLGRNELKKEDPAQDDSGRFFANFAAYWRPAGLKEKLGDTTLFVRAGFNDYTFSTASREFSERTVTAGINTAF
ncbi:MAG: hypothetical protein RDU13_07145 [Elusimicrobiales bacterium]|nr:hypothetical protein [Elusimicrobiales bacterium]